MGIYHDLSMKTGDVTVIYRGLPWFIGLPWFSSIGENIG